MSNKTDRKPQINFEVQPEFKDELEEISRQTQISVSQICRQGTFKEVAELKRTHPLLTKQETANA